MTVNNLMESRESTDLDLNSYLSMVKRQWLPALVIFGTTLALSVVVAISIEPAYQAEAKLLFKSSSFKVAGSSLLPNNTEGTDAGELKSLVSNQSPIFSQIEVISSTLVLQKVIEKLQLKNSRGKLSSVEELQSDLTLKILGGSDVLQIAYKSTNPTIAAQVVNTIAEIYLANDIKINRDEVAVLHRYLDRQLPGTQAAVNQAELGLRQFKQKYQIVDLAEESKSAVAIIGNLETAMGNTRAQLAEITAQSNELQQKLDLNSQKAMAVSSISQSPTIQSSLTQLQEIERQLTTERSRFLENNPIIVNLKEKQAKLTTLLKQQTQQTSGELVSVAPEVLRIGDLKQNLIKDFLQLEVQRTGLNQKLVSLSKSRSDYAQRVNVIPQLAQKQHQLERNLEVSQSTNQTLLKKIQELKILKDKTTPNARVISAAIAPRQAQVGSKVAIVSFGLLIGGFLSTVAMLVLEFQHKPLRSLRAVKEAFGYNLLGILPSLSKKTLPYSQDPPISSLEIVDLDFQQSLATEMSLLVQSNLKLAGSEQALKTIVVTSSIGNEGKSKVAATLATAIAQTEQRVLLIDADMREPTQHRFWKLPLEEGLNEVLADRSNFKAITFPVMRNLDILTAGAKPDRSLACLDYQQMRMLIKEVSELYDFVIIDTPPILSSADPLILGCLTDGVLLVTRPGLIEERQISLAQEKLTMSNCKVLGLIVNGVN